MNAFQFITAIRSEVRDSATKETISLLEHPPGRRPPVEMEILSQWFNGLSEGDRKRVGEIAALASHQAVFGFLCVLDGVRAVDESTDKGILELHYVKARQRILLNDPNGPSLHDILQQP